jgi:hypothetical protein
MGRVSAYANVIEQFSLPKEYEVAPSEDSIISEASLVSSINQACYSENRNFKKQSTK